MKSVTFFFGAGAEICYGLKSGASFNGALLRCDYKKECTDMLGEAYKKYALVYSSSTKVFLQTIDKEREKAKAIIPTDEYNKCIAYIEEKRDKESYSKIQNICRGWYKQLFDTISLNPVSSRPRQ